MNLPLLVVSEDGRWQLRNHQNFSFDPASLNLQSNAQFLVTNQSVYFQKIYFSFLFKQLRTCFVSKQTLEEIIIDWSVNKHHVLGTAGAFTRPHVCAIITVKAIISLSITILSSLLRTVKWLFSQWSMRERLRSATKC